MKQGVVISHPIRIFFLFWLESFKKRFVAGGGNILRISIREFDGLQGKIRFDAYGDVEPSMISMRIVRDRKFVVVE